MEKDKELLDFINNNLTGFNYSLLEYLDHTALLSWINYIAHRIPATGGSNVNFDDRPYIQLPSGLKVVINIKVRKYNEK